MITLEQLGQKIRDMRSKLGFSQEFVADELGLKRQAIISMEAGKRKVDSFELLKLSQLFGIDIKTLLSPETTFKNSLTFLDAVMHLRADGKLSERDKKHLIEFHKICSDYKFLKKIND